MAAIVAPRVGVSLTLGSSREIQPHGLVYRTFSDITSSLHAAHAQISNLKLGNTFSGLGRESLFLKRSSKMKAPDA